MEAIKTSSNVEFDVIYADGTRKRVSEGVLFGVENEKIVFHNGTSRPAVFIAVAEAASEVVGAVGFSEEETALLIHKIYNRLFERKEGNHNA